MLGRRFVGNSFLISAVFSILMPMAHADELSNVAIIARSEWSNQPLRAEDFDPKQYKPNGPIKYISIHYTSFFATHDRFDEVGLLRNLQSGHIDRKFGDIAYHFLITHSGTAYRGRPTSIAAASGTSYIAPEDFSAARYTNNGQLIPESVEFSQKPGHTEGHLTVSFNVGLGEPQMLPDSAMENGAKLIAHLLFENNLQPKDVKAHREVANSSCPGDLIYEWLRGPSMTKDGEGLGLKLIKTAFQRLQRESGE